ncbi:MAG: restriction endonuclease subunit S [Bacteroidales bacterium]|nr:restriction endonuclease subunit S [Bacteroidales bacterium]MDD6131713.1 restriction endonuclease subunit S [Bacteroidales bacterium]
MSKLQDLIDRLCPNGVEFKPLGDLLDYEQPTKYIVCSTEYDNNYKTPVLTAGQSFILGYTDETEGVFPASKEKPVIIFDDFTTSFHWVDFPFKVKSSAMKILYPKTKSVNFKYIHYAMQCIGFVPGEHTRYWISKYSRFTIPLPPLEVQEEIVKILDRFADYAAELQAELQARKEQYEYYRNLLLTFNPSAYGSGTDDEQKDGITRWGGRSYKIQWKTMGEIGNVKMCKRIMKNQTSSMGDVPFYKIGTFGKEPDAYISRELFEDYKHKYSFPSKGTILISAAGTIGRCVIYDGEDAYFQDSNIVWLENDEKQVLNSYLYYFYQIVDWDTDGGTIKRLYNDKFLATPIPIPPMELQEKIVAILDRFETLVNDLSKGLPAEIAAVKAQYEYYRNKLLTFKDVAG